MRTSIVRAPARVSRWIPLALATSGALGAPLFYRDPVQGDPAQAAPAGQGEDARAAEIPPEASAAFERGREHYRRHDPVAAAAELRQAVALAPRWAEAHRALGKLLLSMTPVWFATPVVDRTLLEEATRELLAAHALEPGHADGAYWAGRALALAQDAAEAERLLLVARELDPAHGLACKELGMLYAASGDHERARAQLERAAELRPKDDEVQFHLGLQHEAAGDLAGAVAAHRRALALNPSHLGPRMRLITLCHRAGESEEAELHVREVERWRAFGQTLKAALDRHQKAPGDAAAALAVGVLYLEAGMSDTARDWFEVALESDPGNEEAARRLRELEAPPAGGEAPR